MSRPRERAVSLWPRDVVADAVEIAALARAIGRQYPQTYRAAHQGGGNAAAGPGDKDKTAWSDPTANVVLDERKEAQRRSCEAAARLLDHAAIDLRAAARELRVAIPPRAEHSGEGAITATDLDASYEALGRRIQRGDE